MMPALADDVLAAAGVDIEHHFIANELYSKRALIKAGASLGKHTHPFDHASALISGRVRLTVEGETNFLTGPCWVFVKANKEHVIHALTDVVWHCLHITSETDPTSVDATILKG